MTNSTRKKVAVLGGGLGSLSAAFELTSTPELREQYEVTVYQLGWRIGGKGASGRDPDAAYRIQEHGLHMLMGWYQNGFQLIRRCYDEWQPTTGCPFASWEDAFKIHNELVFMDLVAGEWQQWRLTFPRNAEVPGDGGIFDDAWDYWVMAIEWLEATLRDTVGLPAVKETHEFASILRKILDEIGHLFDGDFIEPEKIIHPSLHRAIHLTRKLQSDTAERTEGRYQAIDHLLGEVRGWLQAAVAATEHLGIELYRAYVVVDLVCAAFRGLWKEGFPKLVDFDKFDHVDLRAWLKDNGASEMAVQSGPLRSFYELGFAYIDGDFSQPAVAAGSGLRAMMRMGFGYKGGVLWAMEAAMGDTIFTPLYDVLRARGVRFEFFREVKNLCLSADGQHIDAIDTVRQVQLNGAEYDPLIHVNGLRCWPSHPDWNQIVDGEWLKEHDVNLESHWAELPNPVPERLELGRDFDLVVFGLSQGSIPFVCTELLGNERWKKSVEKVKTVQTQSLQLWLHPNRRGLQWKGGPSVLTSYVEPFSSWADMTHLVPRERWPQHNWPGSIAYLCGAMPSGPQAPPASDRAYPKRENEKVKRSALEWLQGNATRIWPGAAVDGEFNWEILIDLEDREGTQRLDGQYWRANVDPSQRYVLCVPGSTMHRLVSDDPDFKNLYLAGDWVRSCINGGCVEGAVVGGLQASRAICGVPAKIQGE